MVVLKLFVHIKHIIGGDWPPVSLMTDQDRDAGWQLVFRIRKRYVMDFVIGSAHSDVSYYTRYLGVKSSQFSDCVADFSRGFKIKILG